MLPAMDQGASDGSGGSIEGEMEQGEMKGAMDVTSDGSGSR